MIKICSQLRKSSSQGNLSLNHLLGRMLTRRIGRSMSEGIRLIFIVMMRTRIILIKLGIVRRSSRRRRR